MKNEYYENDAQYLRDELRRICLKCRMLLRKVRNDSFVGRVFRHDSESESVTNHADGFSLETDGAEQVLALLTEEVCRKKEASLRNGITLSIDRVSEVFGLTPIEKEALLFCLAPELDPGCAQVFALLRNEPGNRSPTVGLLCELLSDTPVGTAGVRQCFSPESPLIRYRLLEFDDGPAGNLLTRSVTISERMVDLLCGLSSLEYRISPFVRLINPQQTISALVLPEEVKAKLSALSRLPFVSPEVLEKGLLFYFYGPRGVGKTNAAEALCGEWKLALLLVDTEGMLNAGIELETAVRLVFRESLLVPAAVCFERFEELLKSEEKAVKGRFELLHVLRELSWLTFMEGEAPWRLHEDFGGHLFHEVAFTVPGSELRRKIWEGVLAQEAGSDGFDLNALANRFLFTAGQIKEAVRLAVGCAMQRDPVRHRVSYDDIYAACRSLASRDMGNMALKVRPRYTLQDIVLPERQMEQIKDIISRVRHQSVVYEKWGFERKFSMGRGLKVLFTGLSGTGKTMAAEIVAHELGVDLYKVDLSAVVSKYVGETEKNLAKIFEATQGGNAVLFFDEADALFGKRTEVKDAHDRYANVETGYLLQRMEEYDGVVILATNLQKNMDEAFTRRLHFIVEFPMPAEEHRYLIWKGLFPPEAPVAGDVDFAFLAGQFKIAGGNIKNIVMDAAFLAADDAEAIGMKHLLRAAKRELQKMGKTVREEDFGGYKGLVEAV
ncbi:MAG: AAA family ATPase [Bacillota bacterium]